MSGVVSPPAPPVRREQPGAKVRVVPLLAAIKDAKDFLNAGQYLHLTDIVKRLADWENREEISDLRVEPIQGMWELQEKGGILGRINVRVYFAYLKQRREVVVLGAFKKECEGQTPGYVLLRVRNRLRIYLEELAD